MESENKVLIDIEIKDAQLLADLAKVKTKMDELRQSIAELNAKKKDNGKLTEEETKRLIALQEQLKFVGGEYRDLSKEAQDSLNIMKTKQKEFGDSVFDMRKELSGLTKEYYSLSKAEREGAKGQELNKHINELTDSIKKAEEGIQVYNRNVGNYKSAIEGLVAPQGSILGTIQKIGKAVPTSAEGFKQATTAVKSFGKQLLSLLANPIIAIISAIVIVVKEVVDAFQRSEEAMNALKVATSALSPIIDVLKRAFELLAKGVAKVIEGLVQAVSAVIKFYATIGDKIAGLFGFETKLAEGFEKAQQMARDLEEMKQKHVENVRKLTEKEARYENEVAELMAKTTDKIKHTSKERQSFLEEAISKQEEIAKERKRLAEEELEIAEREAARSDNDAQANERLAQARANVYKAETEFNQKMRKYNSQRVTLANEIADANYKAEESLLAYNQAMKENEREAEKARVNQADLNEVLADNQKTYEAKKQAEIDKLNLKKKYGKIEAEEYARGLSLINAKDQAFYDSQEKLVKERFANQIEAIRNLVTESVAEQLQGINTTYADAQTNLEAQNERYIAELAELSAKTATASLGGYVDATEALTAEEKQRYDELNKLIETNEAYALRLEEERIAKVNESQANNTKKRIADITNAVNAENELELAMYADNESKKLRISIEASQKKLEELGKALEAEKDETSQLELQKEIYKEQANLRKEQLQLLVNESSKELAQSNLSARKQYEVRRDLLLKELELYAYNADKRIEIEKQIADLNAQHTQQMIANIEMYANSAVSALTSINDIQSNLEQSDYDSAEKHNEKKKQLLETRLKSGAISQKEYNKQAEKADAELEKKKAELDIKQAKRQRQLSLTQATINIAEGVTKAIAQGGIAGIATGAIVAALGALQIATITSQPLPKAKRGMLVAEDGGLLRGASHAQGGIPIEAEGGEAIINKRSTAMFRPLLSKINQMGGGVKFANGGIVGDFGGMVGDNSNLAEQLGEQIAKLKVVTSVEAFDVAKAEKNVIVNKTTF